MNLRTEQQAIEDSIFRVGTVISVKGRTVEVRVDKAKNTSHLLYQGELLRNVSVGGYVKIAKGFTFIVGKVEGEETALDRFQRGKTAYSRPGEEVDRILTLSLLGFFEGCRFERGIKELPLVDNECFLLKKEEFEAVHDFIKKGDEPLTIGSLAFEKSQPVRVGVNTLFASHIGVFGNTGSGKSYTLAKIYRELFIRYCDRPAFRQKSQFVLIDFNGEYVDGDDQRGIIIDPRYKRDYHLSTRSNDGDRYPVLPEVLEDPDFWIVFLEATEKTQMPFLRRAIAGQYVANKLRNEDEFKDLIGHLIYAACTVSDRTMERTIVINFLSEVDDALGGRPTLAALISDYRERLKFHSGQSRFFYDDGSPPPHIYSDMAHFREDVVDSKVAELELDVDALSAVDKARLQIVVQYYDDIIRGFANKEHLAPLIKRLDRRFDDLKRVIEVRREAVSPRGKFLTVVSLRDVNIHMRKVLPLLICKRLYADKKADKRKGRYLNIILDEAHNILSENSARESDLWKDYRLETFEEIIKEGRKFGVFLTVASQRPSDISATIISQLHTYFLHRLINNEDIQAVRQTISYLDRVSFDYVPLLPTGTCILAGLLANVPVVVDIGAIEPKKHEPRNKTLTLTDSWGHAEQ